MNEISLYTATIKQLQGSLKKNSKNTAQYRRAADRLNEILKFLKRDIKILKPQEEILEIHYLNQSDIEKLANLAPTSQYKFLTRTLFGTGARLGEALAMNSDSLVGERLVYIGKQITRRGSIKGPKRNKKGIVSVISSEWSYVQQWTKIDKDGFDRWSYYKWITATSARLWPSESRKLISPHSLRHSHAIHLLSKGASLTEVSFNLRNRIEVCQKYYTGFAHTSETVDRLKYMI